MSVLWHCYYHVVWATKYRQNLIMPEMENTIFDIVHSKTRFVKGVLHAINAVPDHVHVAVSLPPSVLLSKWVKQAKGAASHEVNVVFTNIEPRFQWQRGYSIHTFGLKVLPFVVEYIKNQKEHHANGTTESYLEDIDMN